MNMRVSAQGSSQFKSPRTTLGDFDAEAAARVLAAAGDVAVVLDRDGRVLDVAVSAADLSRDGFPNWQDRPWSETATQDSRHKIDELLKDAAAGEPPRWREVNHTAPGGGVVPIRYVAVPLGGQGHLIAIGRDLRAVAALQQRLIQAQQAMERDYARLRQTESRYRLLFQQASEAVVILDAGSRKILEVNPAAAALCGATDGALSNQSFVKVLDRDSIDKASSFLAAVETAGRSEPMRVRLRHERREIDLAASLFRQDKGAHILLRLAPVQDDAVQPADPRLRLVDVVERMPDAFVVTDDDLQILAQNSAFLELAQLPNKELARGQSLERFLGRPGVDLTVLVANLRQYGSVRNFGTVLRTQFDGQEEVEVSAVAAPDAKPPCLGFTIRSIGRRLGAQPRSDRELPRSVEQLTDLVGRVPLKEIVRETADIIERLCIEAALDLTSNNRASAAEILGLSRQSLYSKLHRYGLGNLGGDAE